MRIEWRDDLSIGVPSIDDQHRELFTRFNGLIQACNEGKGREKIAELIKFLRDYTEVHFLDEETLQQEIGYPDFEAHRRQHHEFIQRISAMEDDFARNGASLSLVIRANGFLVEWLIGHISRADRQVGTFLNAKGRKTVSELS